MTSMVSSFKRNSSWIVGPHRPANHGRSGLLALGRGDHRGTADRGAGADIGVGQVGPVRIASRSEYTSLVVKATVGRLDRLDETAQSLSHRVGRRLLVAAWYLARRLCGMALAIWAHTVVRDRSPGLEPGVLQ